MFRQRRFWCSSRNTAGKRSKTEQDTTSAKNIQRGNLLNHNDAIKL